MSLNVFEQELRQLLIMLLSLSNRKFHTPFIRSLGIKTINTTIKPVTFKGDG